MSTSDKEKIVSHFRVIGANRIVNRRLMLISQNSDFFFQSIFCRAQKQVIVYILSLFSKNLDFFRRRRRKKKYSEILSSYECEWARVIKFLTHFSRKTSQFR